MKLWNNVYGGKYEIEFETSIHIKPYICSIVRQLL